MSSSAVLFSATFDSSLHCSAPLNNHLALS